MYRAFGIPVIVAVLGATGCAIHRSISGPAVPSIFVVSKTSNSEITTAVSNFEKCLATGVGKCDRAERDRIVYALKLIIDRNYEEYAKNFEQVADTSTFIGEISAASLSGVGPLLADVGTKDILTLASTLTQSTTVSMQKNFYQKQTSYAILVVMDSQRLTKWSEILTSIQDHDINEYPLGAALADLADYRREGTAVKALESIQQTAGSNQSTAQKTINDTR